MILTARRSILLVLLLSIAIPSHGAVYALVIGIDDYRFQRGLYGAVNDARLIAAALEKAGVADISLLLNAEASRAAIEAAWERMVAKSHPGDTFVVTYAGHGAQEPDQNRDETDGKDEVLVLGGFRPQRPGIGERILDDELNRWFAKVPDRQILFIADACHSGTLTRGVDPRVGVLSVRTIGDYGPIEDDELVMPSVSPTHAIEDLSNVTFFSASRDDQESLELNIDGRPHGALSWAFAAALGGEGDSNRDGVLDKGELSHYLIEKVRILVEGKHEPQVIPRGGEEHPLLRLAPRPVIVTPAQQPLSVHITGSGPELRRKIRAGLSGIAESPDERGADAVIDLDNRQVLNGLGDVLSDFGTSTATAIQPILDKQLAVMRLRHLARNPVPMRILPGDDVHLDGDIIRLELPVGDLNALTLFNLTGDGTVQLLFPIAGESPLVGNRVFTLPIRVGPPFGGDHLIGLLTEKPLPELHATLKSVDGKQKSLTAAQVLEAEVQNHRYQLGIAGVYTRPLTRSTR